MLVVWREVFHFVCSHQHDRCRRQRFNASWLTNSALDHFSRRVLSERCGSCHWEEAFFLVVGENTHVWDVSGDEDVQYWRWPVVLRLNFWRNLARRKTQDRRIWWAMLEVLWECLCSYKLMSGAYGLRCCRRVLSVIRINMYVVDINDSTEEVVCFCSAFFQFAT